MSWTKGIIASVVLVCLALVPVVALGGVGLFVIMAASSSDGGSTTTGQVSTTAWDSSAVPEAYRDDVQRAGSLCEGITPSLISAQIEAESSWNPDVTSYMGAQGIAQFMPETWAESGRDGDGDGKAEVTNPEDAIYSQGVYMCAQLEAVTRLIETGAVQGDPVSLALAAYNAGLGKVQEAGGIPPFPVTVAYVDKIMAAARTRYAQVGAATGSTIIEAGERYLGLPYVWGSADPAVGLDCSGFVQRTFADLGVALPRTADDMGRMSIGTDVPAELDEMQPGDIIAFRKPGAAAYHHVAIYAGNGQILHASWYGTPLGYSDLSDFQGETWTAKRVTVPQNGGDQ